MTIRAGSGWGTRGGLAPGEPVVDSDARCAAIVATGVLAADPKAAHGPRAVGLTGGDLWRTLGGPAAGRAPGDQDSMRLPIDVGEYRLDEGEPAVFVAHLVLRGRTWWRERTVAIMNAGYLGGWNLAPRGHPGDGRFDVVDGRLGRRDRRLVRKRLAAGTHLPHPDLHVSRIRSIELTFDPPATSIEADGVPQQGPIRTCSVRVHPDAAIVVV